MKYPEIIIDGKQIERKRISIIKRAFEIFIKECENRNIELKTKKIKICIDNGAN